MHFTQIGSLPFDDIDEAINYSFQHSIPFVPDLPAVSSHEFMIDQAKCSVENPYQQVCLNAFKKRLNEYNGIIKNQLPGPLCISQYLNWEAEKAFMVWSTLLEDRIQTFKEFKNPLWLFIDEPTFFQHPIEMRKRVLERLDKINDVFIAIHYCGSEKIDLLDWPESIALSYDLSLHHNISYQPQICGIGDKTPFPRQSTAITPACGLWGNSEPYKVLENLKTVSK